MHGSGVAQVVECLSGETPADPIRCTPSASAVALTSSFLARLKQSAINDDP